MSDSLGVCCFCREREATVALMLDYQAPVPGTGWGCVVCDLPYDGAVCVLCQWCWLNSNGNPLFQAWLAQPLVCRGFPKDNERSRLTAPVPFRHDSRKHEAEEAEIE